MNMFTWCAGKNVRPLCKIAAVRPEPVLADDRFLSRTQENDDASKTCFPHRDHHHQEQEERDELRRVVASLFHQNVVDRREVSDQPVENPVFAFVEDLQL